MSISPQGYTLGGDPQNINPFWGEDEQTNWTIEAEATVDNTTGSPSVNVETETDTTTKTKTFTFEFTGLKGEIGETGDTGATGNGIVSIDKTSTSGLVDTYTITFTNGTTTTFTVTNGADGATGDTGNGISSIAKTSTSGLVDTYTITFTDGTTTTFDVTNGSSSGGSTVTVTQVLSTGTQIASITVDGVTTDLYAPTGGSGSGTIEGDATVKWAGESLTTQPTTYPYKKTTAYSSSGETDSASVTLTYRFQDTNATTIDVDITYTVDYTINSGSKVTTIVYQESGISGSTTSGSVSASASISAVSCSDSNVSNITGYAVNGTTFSNADLRGAISQSISLDYNGTTYTATETSGLYYNASIKTGALTSSITYDVMEAIGIGLVINSNDFSGIVSQVVNKLRCTFENATYYIQQIPYIKISDGTSGTMQITAGAGILFFDCMEFLDVTANTVWGHGMLRIVVPNSGGEYDFQGLIGLNCTDANSISLTLGRGTLTHTSGDVYFTTGGSNSFTVNRTTCSLSAVYAEVI